jgi:hypothetical protein
VTKILTPLILHPLPMHLWVLSAPFTVATEAAGVITIPSSYITDLNSIPRWLWSFTLPSDWAEAAVPHDWAYQGRLPRQTADQLYYELLIAMGMGVKQAKSRYIALRLFGGHAYKPIPATGPCPVIVAR